MVPVRRRSAALGSACATPLYLVRGDGNRTSLTVTSGCTCTPAAAVTSTHGHDDDLPQSVTSDGVTTTFTLDAAGRRVTQRTTGPAGTTTTWRVYIDDSDNRASVEITDPAEVTTIARFGSSIAGGLLLSDHRCGRHHQPVPDRPPR